MRTRMTVHGFRYVAQAIVALAMAGSIAWMFHYYFFRIPTDHLKDVAAFYTDLNSSELTMTEDELRQLTGTGQGADLHKLAARSAFLRYVLDPEPGGIFDRYMEDYQRGLWRVPAPEVWRDIFSTHLSKWEEARKALRQSQLAQRPQVIGTPNGHVLIYTNAKTPMIGKGMDVVISVPQGTDLSQPVEYTWAMAGEISSPGRLAYWEQPESNPVIAMLTLDFSHDLHWYLTDRNLQSITISSPETAGFEVLAVRHRLAVTGSR